MQLFNHRQQLADFYNKISGFSFMKLKRVIIYTLRHCMQPICRTPGTLPRFSGKIFPEKNLRGIMALGLDFNSKRRYVILKQGRGDTNETETMHEMRYV